MDKFPEYGKVDAETAESFKEFHQSERESRKRKWPWTKLEIDYHYFSLKSAWWPYLKVLVLLLVVLPIFKKYIVPLEKQMKLEEMYAKELSKQVQKKKDEINIVVEL